MVELKAAHVDFNPEFQDGLDEHFSVHLILNQPEPSCPVQLKDPPAGCAGFEKGLDEAIYTRPPCEIASQFLLTA